MLKNSMDILDVYAVSRLYSKTLLNGVIDNVYYVDQHWLIKVNTKEGLKLLKIEPGVRFHLSRVEPEVKTIDRFTQFLRKRIRGCKIKNVEQIGWERIISVSLAGREDYKIIVEIIPRGFFTILDANNVILYASRFVELRDRVIKPKVLYQPPPGNLDRDQYFQRLVESIYQGKDFIRGLVKGWGLPKYIAEEITFRAGLYEQRTVPIDNVARSDIENAVEQYRALINECELNLSHIVYGNGVPQLYVCYEPKLIKETGGFKVAFIGDLNEAIDSYFTYYEKKLLENKVIATRRGELEKVLNTIRELEKLKEQYNVKYEENIRIYNILLSNFNKVNDTLECVNRIRESEGWNNVVNECKEVFDVDKHSGSVFLKIDGEIVKLDVRLNTWGNINSYSIKAGEYYSSARKVEEKIKEFRRRYEELLNSIETESMKTISTVKPKFWFMRYHWLITQSGFIAVGGRNADQNESLVRKIMEPDDIFIHADIHGAPVVVLKTNGKTPLENDIYDAAVITACYSKAWKAGFGYIDFYWVKGSQVSKKAPSGEYLTKGSFMIYGERNYGRVELKLSIGLEEVHDDVYGTYRRVIIGPQNLVKERSLVYVTLVPGDENPDKLSKRIYKLFQNKTGLEVVGVTIDEIRKALPGPSRVT